MALLISLRSSLVLLTGVGKVAMKRNSARMSASSYEIQPSYWFNKPLESKLGPYLSGGGPKSSASREELEAGVEVLCHLSQ